MRGGGSFDAKRHRIHELERENEELRREIEQHKARILRLEDALEKLKSDSGQSMHFPAVLNR